MATSNSKFSFGLSQKRDGSMRVTKDDRATENRRAFFASVGFNIENSVVAGLEHGSNIKKVDASHRGTLIENTDGLITDTPGLILTVTVADCLPLYLYDVEGTAVGIAHAGWKGVLNNLSGKMVESMVREFNIDPSSLKVTVGPHIKKCHFEVKEDVADQFEAYKDFVFEKEGRLFIDLAGIVAAQLAVSGILADHIRISSECTYEEEKYFSYRRDRPEKTQAMVAYIVLP